MTCARLRLQVRTVVGLLSAIGIILGLASWGLWMQYAYTRPQSPDTVVGRIYSLNTHGSIVYLNSQEQFVLYGLQILAGLFFGSAVIIDVTRGQPRSER